MIGIVARMPQNFIFEVGVRMNGAGGAVGLIVEILFLFVVVLVSFCWFRVLVVFLFSMREELWVTSIWWAFVSIYLLK